MAEEILQTQNDLSEEITELLQSFRTDYTNLSIRKTRRFYKSYKEKLFAAFSKVTINHNSLIEELPTNHNYFTSKVFSTTKIVYDELLELLKKPEASATYDDEDVVANEGEIESKIDTNQILREIQEELSQLGGNEGHDDDNVHPNSGTNKRPDNFVKNLADLLYGMQKNDSEEIIEFDDDPSRWIYFRNMYEVSVHNKTSISNLQKFSILIKKITGKKGKAVLSGIQYTPDNYIRGWEAIVKTFHNKAQLIRHEFKEFNSNVIQTGKISKNENLRDVLNKTRRFLSNITSIFQIQNKKDLYEKAFHAFLIITLENQLDATTKLQWGGTLRNETEMPKISEMLTFLEDRAKNYETYSEGNKFPEALGQKRIVHSMIISSLESHCIYCKELENQSFTHSLGNCTKFDSVKLDDKWKVIKKHNCFKDVFSSSQYSCSQESLETCGGKHNIILHENRSTKTGNKPYKSCLKQKTYTEQSHAIQAIENKSVVPTAIVAVHGKTRTFQLRALIDSGSDSNFISAEACKLINGDIAPAAISVYGLGDRKQNAKGIIRICAQSVSGSDFVFNFDAIVVNHISHINQNEDLKIDNSLFKDFQLADTHFQTKYRIDIILGISEIVKLNLEKPIKLVGNIDNLFVIKSALGWLLCGSFSKQRAVKQTHAQDTVDEKWEKKTKDFWKRSDENVDERGLCEELFLRIAQREKGRYIVRITLKEGKKHCFCDKQITNKYMHNIADRATFGFLQMLKKYPKRKDLKLRAFHLKNNCFSKKICAQKNVKTYKCKCVWLWQSKRPKVVDKDNFKKRQKHSNKNFFSDKLYDDQANENISVVPTVIIEVQGKQKTYQLRALIDTGSDLNIISAKACKLINATIVPTVISVYGLGDFKQHVEGKVNVLASSITGTGFEIDFDAMVVNHISRVNQNENLKIDSSLFEHLPLADPHFQSSAQIDVIFGISEIVKLNFDNPVRLSDVHEDLFAIKSSLGILLCGSVYKQNDVTPTSLIISRAAVETEEMRKKTIFSLETQCEDLKEIITSNGKD